MITILKIVFLVYLAAINFYGFLLIAQQKREENEDAEYRSKDSKAILTGIFGGALGVYIAMFIFRYHLKSFALMVLIPIFIAISVFSAVMLFTQDMGVISDIPFLL